MRQGYQLFATDPVEGPVASYAEAESPGQAAERCYLQFPLIDGFTEHKLLNIETRAEYNCKKKEPDFSLKYGLTYTLEQIHRHLERRFVDRLFKLTIFSDLRWSLMVYDDDRTVYLSTNDDGIQTLIDFCLKEEKDKE